MRIFVLLSVCLLVLCVLLCGSQGQKVSRKGLTALMARSGLNVEPEDGQPEDGQPKRRIGALAAYRQQKELEREQQEQQVEEHQQDVEQQQQQQVEQQEQQQEQQQVEQQQQQQQQQER